MPLYNGKDMSLAIDGRYNLAISWAVMGPDETSFTNVSYSAV